MNLKVGDYLAPATSRNKNNFAHPIVEIKERYVVIHMGYFKHLPNTIVEKYWVKMPGYFKSPLWEAIEGKR